MSSVTDFNRRIDAISVSRSDWSEPLVDVIDTASAIAVGIQSEMNVECPAIDCPELLLGLTKLAIERHDLDGVNYISPRQLK